jgi:hypothetical protein
MDIEENETSLVDFASLIEFSELTEEDGIESVVELIHKTALQEFCSRDINSVWDWQTQTKGMFKSNFIYKVSDIIVLPAGRVNRLISCGYSARKEVYDVFCMYHLQLNTWKPEEHYSKKNYKF